MSKLFKFKQSLSLKSAAQYLSTVFEEPVSIADVLELALDGHLRLSVLFVNPVDAKRSISVPPKQAKMFIVRTNQLGTNSVVMKNVRITDDFPEKIKQGLQDGSLHFVPQGGQLLKGENPDTATREIWEYEDDFYSLEGVYDLPMIWIDRLYVEHRYQQETGGPQVHMDQPGVFVRDQNGNLYELGTPAFGDKCDPEKKALGELHFNCDDFYPLDTFPEDSTLVVRTKALTEFLDELNDSEAAQDKPLTERAETTYLNIIGGLLELMLDPDATERKRSLFGNQTAVVTELLERYPNTPGLSKRTIEDKFAAANRSLQQHRDLPQLR